MEGILMTGKELLGLISGAVACFIVIWFVDRGAFN